MQVLTPNGYVNIEDLNVGDEVIAYDINDGHVFTNILEKKDRWTYDMFPPEYDDDGNIIKTSEQVFQETYGEWKFYLINNTWTLFWGQSVWANLKVIHANELQVGDIIYDDNDNDVVITDIQEVTAPEWWRLTISGDHSYIADNLTLHNASRYWVGGGSSANWNATGNTNWGSSSGTQDNASVPTSTDDAIFDGAGTGGNSNSTISATITILSLNITSGYTAQFTNNATLTINGNITLGANCTYGGLSSAILQSVNNATITSNNVTLPFDIQLSSASTKTLIGNLNTTQVLRISNTVVINKNTSEIVTCYGLSLTASSGTGTADIYIKGGIWSGNFSLGNNLFLDGNVTISGAVQFAGNTLIYISGTITVTSSTLTILGSTVTLNTNGITWNNITSNNSTKTITLTSNLLISGLFTNSGITTINKTASETITLSGGMTANSDISGTADIYFIAGTITHSSGQLNNNAFINGNITISQLAYATGTLTYLSGTISYTGNGLLYLYGSCTLNLPFNLLNLRIRTTLTVTLQSDLTYTGTFTWFATSTTTINSTTSEKVYVYGSIDTLGILTGSADVYFKNGSTWLTSSGANELRNNTFIDGNLTITGTVYYRSGTLSYLSGAVTLTGSTLNLTNNCTLNTNVLVWNNVTSNTTTKTITLTSNLSMSGLFTVGISTTINTSVGATWTTSGGIAGAVLSGTAKIILTGGTWSGSSTVSNNLDLQGNITISGTVVYSTGILTYVSGTVITTSSTLSITGSCTLNTNGITWNNVNLGSTATITLTSNFLCSGLVNMSAPIVLNRTITETFTIGGGFSVGTSTTHTISGATEIILTGGTWSSNNGRVNTPLTLNGNITISGNVYYSTSTLTYNSGKVTNNNGGLNITASATVINFHKVPLSRVVITSGQTVTMNRFFTGTPSKSCQVSSTGANYTIQFQDNFEKIGGNVQVSGCTLARPLQLLVINNSRFNTNRSTNVGVRYINQSPNGFARNAPSITDTMTVPALGLVSDPNFKIQ